MNFAKEKIINESARSSFSGTLLSRASGFVRDIVMAYTFGSSPQIAALMLAFRFSSLLRRLFGEGALHAAFVPSFEKIREESEEKAALFFKDLSLLIGISLLFIIGVAEFTLGGCLSILNLDENNTQILVLSMILFPTLFFVCNTAFASSLMQCLGQYFVPAASSFIFNCLWIFGVLLHIKTPPNKAVIYLSLWMALGLLAQWVALLPKALLYLRANLPKTRRWSIQSINRSFKNIAKPFGLGIIGVSTTQINSALDGVFARSIALEGPAYLWYAIRIEQVPLALFGVAMAGAILPPLFRAFREDNEEFISLLDYSFSQAMGVLIPCTIALIWIGPTCVNLFYGRGMFDLFSAHHTTYALWGYSLGLIPQGLILVLAPAFYVQNQYQKPTRASVIAMMLNILLNCFFAFILKLPSYSVALATALCAWVQLFILFYYLNKSLPLSRLGTFFKSITPIFLITGASALLAYLFSVVMNPWVASNLLLYFPRGLGEQVSIFATESLIFLGFLFMMAKFFKVKEVLSLFSYIPFVEIEDKPDSV